jgi:hypothetical protein
MRPYLVASACVLGLIAIGDARADVEPYEARVITPRALVYSGPGEKFYPTSTLAPGDTVEVYREEAGGWLGIRPSESSFSLVPEKQLQLQADGLAEVRDDDVACRIGSELSDKRNAVQVRLKRGEVVEILGKTTIDGETWCKIAPPAGEFRWIHAASVERSNSLAVTPDNEDESNDVIQVAATETVAVKSEGEAKTSSAPPAAPPLESTPAGDNWRASTSPVATQVPATAPTQEVAPPPLAPTTPAAQPIVAPTTPAAPPAAAAAPITPVPAAPPVAATPTTGVDLPRQLTDIELRLSRMASAPPQLWNTERLQRDTEQLLARAQTQTERDMIKATMAKIDRFTVLAKRYQTPAPTANPAASDPRAAGAMAAAPTAGGATPGAPVGPIGGDPRYDAVGVLRPVVSKRPGAPQFALVDDRGQVITFVTPTPDVNLQPYLGRRVGIAGNRGFIPEFNRAHVTAGRVTPVTERTLR